MGGPGVDLHRLPLISFTISGVTITSYITDIWRAPINQAVTHSSLLQNSKTVGTTEPACPKPPAFAVFVITLFFPLVGIYSNS